MSGRQRHFFGAFDPRGRAAPLDAAFAAMAAPLAAPRWLTRDAAPGPHLRIGLRAHRIGEAAPGADLLAPMTARLGDLFAYGEATLFNAPTPGRRADPAHPAPVRANDESDLAPVARLAGLAGGDGALGAALAGVEGDFALALYDPRAATLVLARDHFGHAPLWLARRGDGVTLFATSPHCLLNAPGVSRAPDPASLALFLAIRSPGAGHSFFADIAEVAPASVLRLGLEGGRARRYWRPAPDTALADLPDAEILDAVRARAETAILSRAPRGAAPALTFSGGLDSALIAAVLARRGPVNAFCSVLPAGADPALSDERAHQQALRARWPGVTLHEVTAGDADPLAPAGYWWDKAAAPNPDVMHVTSLLLARAVAARGGAALLNGFGGDFALSSHGDPALFECLMQGRLAALGPEIARRRAAGGRLRNILIGGFLKPLALYDWHRARHPGAGAAHLPGGLRDKPHWRARLAEAGGSLHERFAQSLAAEEAAALAHLPAWAVQDHDLPGGRRVAQRTPLLDARLIGAVLATPARLKLGRAPDGAWRNRALIRSLLRPLVPASIAERVDKDLFQPDFARLMAAALPRMRREARAFSDDPLWREMVDPARYDAALEAARRAPPAQLLSHANGVMLPWFLGAFLMRCGQRP